MTTITPDAIAKRADALTNTLRTLREQLASRPAPTKTSEPVKGDNVVTPVVATNPNRPKSLEEMVGQRDVRLRLQTVLTAAKVRGERMSNVLVSGPAGYGKTSLAELVAQELDVPLISTTGMLLKRSQDLTGLVVSVDGAACLFIDECHAMGTGAAEAAYQ